MNKKSNNLILLFLITFCLIAVIWFLTDFLIADNRQNDPKKIEKNNSDSTSIINLEDSNWTIKEAHNQSGIFLAASGNQAPTVEFSADRVNARICNNISGDYELKNNLITTPGLISTRMACAGNLMVIENIFINSLENNQLLEINNQGNLIIGDGDGGKVILVKQAAPETELSGTHWILSHYRTDGAWRDASANNITLNFAPEILEGKICNHYGGDYQTKNGQLFAANIFLTEMFCADEELMAIEQNLTKTLSGTATYEFDYENNLIIKDGEERQFKFRPAPVTNPLSETTWRLDTKGNGAVWTDLSKANVKITFDADRVYGRACNSFGGSYLIKDEQIIITESIISTLMYCENKDLMDAESTISQTLQSNPEYKLEGDTLTLISAEGLQLKFSRSEEEE
jgi:heat shock protein HslJ